ncbi:MAG TPA: glycosyltransferase family 9 protein [Puia sp.]|jgi:ADP-heptose:LPS heptosyltransferase|nr:glycosyltransferase family 9 protein [Puia sp.]
MARDIIAVTWGGLGDVLMCTPAFHAIKEAHPDRRVIVYCSREDHRNVLLQNPNIDSLRVLLPKYMWRYPRHLYAYLFNSEGLKYYDSKRFKFYYLFFQHVPSVLYEQKHVMDILPEIFGDLAIDVSRKKCELYFTRNEEEKARSAVAPYKNIVFVHVHSKCSENHHWLPERWNELVASLPQYTFIQVGGKNETPVRSAVDWRGRTGLREAFCLFKHGDAFVGVDSCFAHVANAFNVPGVVLFGDSSPVFVGHNTNINIYKGLSCSPCEEYLNGHACPIGHSCMNLITVEEVRESLLRQLAVRKRAYVEKV